MDKDQAIQFLSHPSSLLVVGASNKMYRAGYYVPKFLQEKGFKIIPVNPNEISVLNERCLTSVDDYVGEIESVIFYRRQAEAERLALKLIEERHPKSIWFPDGITSDIVKEKAEENGILFVQDRCPMRDYNLIRSVN